MAIIIEKFDSREATVGIDSPSVDLQFMVLGTELDAEVRALVQATLPLTYGNLVFQNYHIAHQGGGVWEVTARYGKLEPKEAGQSSYSFDNGCSKVGVLSPWPGLVVDHHVLRVVPRAEFQDGQFGVRPVLAQCPADSR